MLKPFPESAFVDIAATKVHYRLWKPIEATGKGKILLVHGFGGSTFSWRLIVPLLLKDGYSVVAADIPPFGFSDKKEGLNFSNSFRAKLFAELTKYIDKNIDGFSATDNWILIGHSMGGSVVAKMAADNLLNVKAMIFIAGAVASGKSQSGFRLPAILAYTVSQSIKLFLLNRKGVERMLKSAYGRNPTTDEIEGYLKPLKEANSTQALFGMMQYRYQPEEITLQNISCPVLLIWGKNDTWVPLSSGQKLNSALKTSTLLIIENCGHCPMETHVDETFGLIQNFLNKL